MHEKVSFAYRNTLDGYHEDGCAGELECVVIVAVIE